MERMDRGRSPGAQRRGGDWSGREERRGGSRPRAERQEFEPREDRWRGEDRWREYGGDESGRGGRAEYGFEEEFGEDRSFGARGEGRFGAGRGGWLGGAPQGFTYTELWLIEGPYTGRGPKGFQRSDERLREQVCERLERHGQIDASDIDVRVEGGVVTLEGTVDDRRTKRLAEDAAEGVPGVQDVTNKLRVDKGFFQRLFGGGESEEESRSTPSRSGRKA